MAARER
ncbi:hypothetical protein E2C01_083774 [Portunus trituberculatus]|nr:hypothetical protein [Portunus trituberculatus]